MSALRAVVDGDEEEDDDDCMKADADDAIMTVRAAVENDFMVLLRIVNYIN
jgi:hypothetical protein